jgi:hypothetical protein
MLAGALACAELLAAGSGVDGDHNCICGACTLP